MRKPEDPPKGAQLSAIHWLGIVVFVPIGLLLAYEFASGGFERQAQREAQKNLSAIHRQVAADAVVQYEIAARKGSAMDRCSAAGLVLAAMLQAKDEAAYVKWKAIETKDCGELGLAR